MAYSRTLNHFTSMQELATIWASGTSYVVNQLVINNNLLYRCLIAHTSTASFSTDLGAGNWVEISASASGIKNYISNGNFENSSTTGWNLARSTLDATTKLPNQASGSWTAAAGTLSSTIVTSGQLSGVASLSLASSAATTAGNMLVTDALTLDLEAQASVQTFSFFYKVVSGAANGNFSGTSSNSIGVAIYVVDGALAGTWIQPAGVWNVVQSSGVGKSAGTFQVPSDATQVRLAVYFPNATTGAITVYLDDFVLGPQVVQYGAPVTDWQDYTPVVGWTGATTIQTAKWRRVGDSAEIFVRIAAGTSSGTARIGLPSGLVVANLPTTQIVGFAALGYNQASSSGFLASSGNTFIQLSTQWGSGNGLSPDTGFAGQTFSGFAKVPILGWSSSVQMSNDTDTRVVAASVSAGTGVNANNTTVNLLFGSTVVDTHAGIGSNQYTVPVAGFYRVVAQSRTSFPSSNVTFNHSLSVYKGAVQAAVENIQGDGANSSGLYWMYGSVNQIISCSAGDVLTAKFTTNYNLGNSNTSLTMFSVERLSGPSAIAASETVAAKYTNTAGTALTTSGTAANIPFATRSYDSHGAFSGTVFTVPVSGKYRITSGLITQAVTLATTNELRIVAIKNGNQAAKCFINGNGANNAQNVLVSTSVDCVAGDTLEIRARISAAASLSTTADDNWICIERIGN